MIFHSLLLFWGTATAWLWWRADRHARPLPPVPRRAARLLFAAFYLALLSYVLVPLLRPVFETEPWFQPPVWVTLSYLWYPVVLNIVIGVVVAGYAWRWFRRRVGGRATAPPADTDGPAGPAGVVRNPSMPASDHPPARARAGGVGATAGRDARHDRRRHDPAGEFRVRRLELVLPGLPPDLDG
jgi:hypothetical protein